MVMSLIGQFSLDKKTAQHTGKNIALVVSVLWMFIVYLFALFKEPTLKLDLLLACVSRNEALWGGLEQSPIG